MAPKIDPITTPPGDASARPPRAADHAAETDDAERADGSLERHPRDGWIFADPFPLSRRRVRQLHGLIRAMCPPEPPVADLEARLEDQVRRMLRYMQPLIAVGFVASLELLDAAPLLMGARRRLHRLPQPQASAIIARLAASPIRPLSDLVAAARAAVLAPYFDLDELAAHIGWRPVPFMRARIDLRERLLSGQAPRPDDVIGPFSAATAARPELSPP